MHNLTLTDKDNVKDAKTHSTLSIQYFLKNKQKILTTMYLNKWWLRCYCKTTPAISFVKLQQGKYILVNHAIKGNHASNCKLYTNVSGEINSGEKHLKILKKPITSFTPLKINTNVDDEKKSPRSVQRKTKATTKMDKIHTFLSYALDNKNLNVLSQSRSINLNTLYYSDMFELKLTENKGKIVKVKDVTYVMPNDRAKNYQSLLKKIAYKFNNNVPLQSNFIFTVKQLTIDKDHNSVSYTNENGEVKHITAINQTHHYERTTGPRIVFVIKAYIQDSWKNYWLYSHPIVSTAHPVFVDSNYERIFAEYFLSFASNDMQLIKPYIPKMYTANGVETPLVPDFIFKSENKGQDCIIEVMGMLNDSDYKERKERIVPMMEKRFKLPVVEVKPDQLKEIALTLFNKS